MKKKIIYTLIVAWCLSIGFVGSHMHSLHKVSFENKNATNLKLGQTDNKWGMVHILGEGCGCSEIIAEHLIKRKPESNTSERVMIIGELEDYESQLKNAGYEVIKEPSIKEYLEGLPMLIVHDPQGKKKYTGAYAKKIITPITKIIDLEIFNSVKNNKDTEKYLVAGCAVSKKLQAKIDPLGLKY